MPDLELCQNNASGFVCLGLTGGCHLLPTASSACEEGPARRRGAAGIVWDDLFWEVRWGWPMLG